MTITFQQKLAILLTLGNLTASKDGNHFYYMPHDEAARLFGITKVDKENPVPFWNNNVTSLVDACFLSLTTNYSTSNPF